MLGNIFLKTLRDYRLTILSWGLGLGLFNLFVTAVYGNIYSGPDKAQLVADSFTLSQSPVWPGGKAADLNTFGGYVTFRFLGMLPVVLGIFTLMAGSGLTRGDEEKGNFDLLLSTPHSRRSVLLQKWAGLVVALLAIEVFSWTGIMLGVALSKTDLDGGAVALTHVNFMACALVFGSFAMLTGQLCGSRKGAGGWAGAGLVAAFFMDTLAGQNQALEWLRYFSPFYYHNLSKPLAPSVGLNWGPFSVLVGACTGLLLAALLLYERRDHGDISHLLKRSQTVVGPDPYRVAKPRQLWLLNNFSFGLRVGLPGAFYWSVLPSLYLILGLSVFPSVRSELLNLLKSDVYKGLGYLALPTNENLLSLPIEVALIIPCIYAVVLVAGWIGEETSGRLELVLSTPEPRWRLLVSRYVVAVICIAVSISFIGLVFGLTAWASNVTVDPGKTFSMFFTGWVVCVIILAGGFGLAAFGPRWTVGLLGGLVVASYIEASLGKSLELPNWVISLSIFEQSNKPMNYGLSWASLSPMLILSLIFIILAVVRFQKRDMLKST